MTTDMIPVPLTLAERHTLHDLLSCYVDERVEEAVKFARYSIDLEAAAERVRRLALLKALAEDSGELPRRDLEALRDELVAWAEETTGTVDEHDAQIVKVDEEHMDEHDVPGREASIAALRRTSTIDYAHACVCERIVSQIEAAREAVSA